MGNRLYINLAGVLLLLTSCKTTSKIYQIDFIKVYQSFVKAGTTSDIYYAFLNPSDRNVDTSKSRIFIDQTVLEKAINASKQKKHKQRKLAGITFAGEFFSHGTKHFFIFFKNANLIIDFTDRREYWLKEPLHYIELH